MSVNAKAVQGVYPDFFVDYSLVLLAKGNLKIASSPTITSPAPGMVAFNWVNNGGTNGANHNDKAVLAIYSEEEDDSISTTSGAMRSSGTANLAAPGWSGKEVHAWIAFVTDAGDKYSNSKYLGKVMIS